MDELSIMVDQWSNRCLMFRRRNCIFTVRNDNYTFAKRKPEKKKVKVASKTAMILSIIS